MHHGIVGLLLAGMMLPEAAWASACSTAIANGKYVNCEGRGFAFGVNANDPSNFNSYAKCAPAYTGAASPDVVFGFTCDRSNHVRMELSGYACNLDLFIVPASCVGNDCVLADTRRANDLVNPDTGITTIEFDCVAGVQYHVVVEAYAPKYNPIACPNLAGAPGTNFELRARCDEICDDGLDNDKDDIPGTFGPTDCDDPDCYDTTACCDDDGDGVNGWGPVSCTGGTDCKDGDRTVYPGALEVVADGVDQDCDAKDACWVDHDVDGFGVSPYAASSDLSCAHPGLAAVLGDCDDDDDVVYPEAPEVAADGTDQNCDGKEVCWVDADGDAYGVAAEVLSSDPDCADPGEAPVQGDCAPADPRVHPLAPETVADGVDQDCDAKDDCWVDADGDRYGSSTVARGNDLDCLDAGEAAVGGDCDDALASAKPGGIETPYDGVDQDCSGADLTDVDADGVAGGALGTDCDDEDPSIKPGALEVPLDGIDQDCDRGDLCLRDRDGDGYGDGETIPSADLDCTDLGETTLLGDCAPLVTAQSPASPEVPYDGVDQDCSGADLVDVDGDGVRGGPGSPDCNDRAFAVRPAASELPNGVDDDCDGRVDDGTTWGDDDGDGFTEVGGDCDDTDRARRPGAVELPNAVDDDCDAVVDDGTSARDDDGDGYCEGPTCTDGSTPGDCHDKDPGFYPGAPETDASGADRDCDGSLVIGDADKDGYAPKGGDCDDQDAAVNPAEVELPNGVDEDCDGIVDEGTEAYDDDRDGQTEQQGDCDDADVLTYDGAPEDPDDRRDDDCDGVIDEGGRFVDDDLDGLTEDQGDCDDTDPDVLPYAPERANAVDDDCDGRVDDGVGDADDDGWTVAQGDCNDTSGWANPERAEVCDGIDNDCDATIDEGCDEPIVRDTDEGVDEGGGCDTTGGVGLAPLALLALRRRRRG